MRASLMTLGACWLAIACTCSKKPDDSPSKSVASAEPSAASGTTVETAAASGAPAAAGEASSGSGAAVGPAGGGKIVAANENGKIQVNDAGATTAKRSNGDSVTTGPGGVTKANGVVVDPKTGTVTVPGKGTFKTP